MSAVARGSSSRSRAASAGSGAGYCFRAGSTAGAGQSARARQGLEVSSAHAPSQSLSPVCCVRRRPYPSLLPNHRTGRPCFSCCGCGFRVCATVRLRGDRSLRPSPAWTSSFPDAEREGFDPPAEGSSDLAGHRSAARSKACSDASPYTTPTGPSQCFLAWLAFERRVSSSCSSVGAWRLPG